MSHDPDGLTPPGGRDAEPGAAHDTSRVARRTFFKGVGLAGAAAAASPLSTMAPPTHAAPPGADALTRVSGATTLTLTVNGAPWAASVTPLTTLLEALRSPSASTRLTGAKPVCGGGACGACSVRLGGQTVASCLVPALDAEGEEVWTVEGLTQRPDAQGLLDAFAELDAAQCGFCIPGFVVRASELLDQSRAPLTPDAVREGLAGNLCRCGTYDRIVRAVVRASERLHGAGGI